MWALFEGSIELHKLSVICDMRVIKKLTNIGIERARARCVTPHIIRSTRHEEYCHRVTDVSTVFFRVIY